MRVLLLNQFYPPDVAPTGCYLQDLARTLSARGHEVHVLSSRWPYGGGPALQSALDADGVQVQRVPGARSGASLLSRSWSAALFLAAALLRTLALRPRPELIVALTSPPYVGLLAALGARWHRAAHAHWVMDLYPDVLAAHGLIGSRGVRLALLRALSRVGLRRACAVVALGPAMRGRLEAWSGPARVLDLPLWSPERPRAEPAARDEQARAARGWRPHELVLLYSGNLGRGHLLQEFLEAARVLGALGPRWVFAGGGARRGELLRFAAAHAEARLESRPYLPKEQLEAQLVAADVHLVSLAPAFRGLIVPSKLQAAFALGRPVLFVGPDECESAQWLRDSGGGWVVAPGDVAGLLRAVAQAGDAHERARRGQAALEFARERFDPELACARLAECLERAVGRAYTQGP